MNISIEDFTRLQEIGYFSKRDTLDDINEYIKEKIELWKEIETKPMDEISLGYYYVCMLLSRDGLQVMIENTTQATSKKIQQAIKTTDDFFKSKMQPKFHHYEYNRPSLKEQKYFWSTHTIHHLDGTLQVKPSTVCKWAREQLNNIDGSWQVLSKIYNEPFAIQILHEHRESQVIDTHLKIEPFMWRFFGKDYDFLDYTADVINNILKYKPTIIFVKTLLFGIFAQFLDFGIYSHQSKEWSIKCLNFLELVNDKEQQEVYELKIFLEHLSITE